MPGAFARKLYVSVFHTDNPFSIPLMWVLHVVYNDTRRSHEYKKNPECVYIADLKVPKTYITINLGESSQIATEPTPLSVTFKSICTTAVNGVIYKLPSKDADPFEQVFLDKDLLFKVNANKSDKIKLHLKWVPVIVLPFSKKIMFDGTVQQSPLPKIMEELISSGIDILLTNDPCQATHYVSLTDMVDHNMKVAVLRAIPIVSRKWCDVLEKSLDDVNSWLFSIRSELYLEDTRGLCLAPNLQRPTLLSGSTALIVTEESKSKHILKFKSWIECLSATEILVKTSKEARELLPSSFRAKVYMFTLLASTERTTNSFASEGNNAEDLWNAVTSVDLSKLKVFEFKSFDSFQHKSQASDIEVAIPLSQRRKRRKLERVEDTDFFLFTPLLSSKTGSECVTQPEHTSVTQTLQPAERLESELDLAGENLSASFGISQKRSKLNPSLETKIKTENTTQDPEDNILNLEIDVTNSACPSIDSCREHLQPRKNEFLLEMEGNSNWIVPQVSLVDAVKSAKEQANNSIKQELVVDNSVTEQLGKLMVVENFEFTAHKKTPRQDNRMFQGRKNFKVFKKVGPKQDSISRTFIELVDDGRDVSFKDLLPPSRIELAGERLKIDLAAEMEDVRGYQPEPSQLFVNEASENENENVTETFQFLSNRDFEKAAPKNDDLTKYITSSRQQIEPELPDETDDDVRFSFTRRS